MSKKILAVMLSVALVAKFFVVSVVENSISILQGAM